MTSLYSLQHNTAVNMLKQQIQQLNYTLQIKQKKILYLQTQLKTTKAQQLRKIEILQTSFNQLKKQNHSFVKKSLQQKKQQNLDFQNQITKLYEENKDNLMQKEKFYQKLLKQKQQKYETTIKNMQIRYQEIIKKLKDQNKTLQNMLMFKSSNNNFKNSDIFTFGNQDYKYMSLTQQNLSQITFQNKNDRSNFIKQKMSMMQQLIIYRQKYQKLLKQLEVQKKLSQQIQNEKEIKISENSQEINLLERQVKNLNSKILQINEENQTQTNVFLEKLVELTETNEKYRTQLKHFEQNYMAALSNRTNQQRPIPIKTVRACNHEGLISQLQKNVQIKNKQIEQLRERVRQWQKMLGFGKNFDERLNQIGNISSRTQQLYKQQKNKIMKSAQKLSGDNGNSHSRRY